MARRTAALLSLLLVASVTMWGAPAEGARTTGWAAWGPITGTSNNYATTMQLPAGGFPRATVASDSKSSVQIPSGASTFLSATSTAVGQKYGSSQGNAYINLRAKADNATSPSRSTYTFDRPTPATGWTFVLGDIDSDSVRISATAADGTPVTAAQINSWLAGPPFNYAGGTDVPTWNGATSTLTGNAAALDTDGASAWFEPNVPLTSLTFTFTRRAGLPIYQTWFASVARTISGTVDDVSGLGACALEDIVVRLVGPSGEPLATTNPAADGTYSFGQYATQPGYTVSLEPPTDCVAVGGRARTVSTAGDDAIADFSVRAVIPQPVSGTVTTTDGSPVADVTVTLTAPGGLTKTTTTDSDGTYLFDDNEEVDGYTVSIDSPPGYGASTPASRSFDIAPGVPVTGQDFVLAVNPNVSGGVSGGGNGIGGVQVSLTPTGGGSLLTTVTGGDGSYVFERVPSGTYTISIDTPSGYDLEPALTGVAVGTTDVPNQDFDLTRPGSIGGSVTDTSGGSATAVPDATVTVDGPGEPRTLTTDADGEYFLDGLPAGTYEITLTVPDGYTAVADVTRTVVITGEGEIRGGQDFTIEREATPSPTTPTDSPTTPTDSPTTPTDSPTAPTNTPTPSPGPSASPTPSPTSAPGTGTGGGGGSGALPDTGADANAALLVGVAATLVGLVVLGGARLIRRARVAR